MEKIRNTLLLLAMITILTGCADGKRNQAPVDHSNNSQIPMASLAETQTVAATPIPTNVDTNSLRSLALGKFPAGTYESVEVLPVNNLRGQPPLWVVYSTGRRNFEAPGSPSHFVALYTVDSQQNWQELVSLNLQTDSDSPSPDYLDKSGLHQVQIDPSRIWLSVEGGIGAHGGIFQLLSFDGKNLKIELTAANDTAGTGSIQDVNDDGVMDVVINVSDNYVFCYACGVRKYAYDVYRWDASSSQMVKVELTTLSSEHPELVTIPNNTAVSDARAGLWKDALSQIVLAEGTANTADQAALDTIRWNRGVIQINATALSKAVGDSPFPLLAKVFFGDYTAAEDMFHSYAPDQIFSQQSPLIIGTIAEGNQSALSDYLMNSTNNAIGLDPRLSEAYFLRAWAEYLNNPADPNIRTDVMKALSLSPQDALYKASIEYLSAQ